MPELGWRQRADETFLVAMPRRGRVVIEMVFLVVLVFAGDVAMISPAIALVIIGAELAVAFALVRPWAAIHGGIAMRIATTLIVLFGVLAPAAVEHPSFAGQSRKLGIGTAVGARAEGDPDVAGGIVAVESVEAHAPADGILRVRDRIVAIGGAPLDKKDPASDLAQRTHGNELPEDTTVTVLREHHTEDLTVHIPKLHTPKRGFGTSIVAVRELSARHLVAAAGVRGALVIALLLVLVKADGQPLLALGLARAGALKELLASTWMTIGAFVVTFTVAIPIGLIGMATGVLQRESEQRRGALGTIAAQGSIIEFALAAVVAAAFEEVAFRGFLTPRMRSLVGSWPLAIVIVSVVFGLGHVYEGVLAIAQTAFLGVYFASMLMLRRRLVGPAVAHAAFNTIMLIVVRIVMSTNIVERLQELQKMQPH